MLLCQRPALQYPTCCAANPTGLPCEIVSFVLGGTMPASSFMQEYACSGPIQKKRTLAGIDQTVVDNYLCKRKPLPAASFLQNTELALCYVDRACLHLSRLPMMDKSFPADTAFTMIQSVSWQGQSFFCIGRDNARRQFHAEVCPVPTRYKRKGHRQGKTVVRHFDTVAAVRNHPSAVSY